MSKLVYSYRVIQIRYPQRNVPGIRVPGTRVGDAVINSPKIHVYFKTKWVPERCCAKDLSAYINASLDRLASDYTNHFQIQVQMFNATYNTIFKAAETAELDALYAESDSWQTVNDPSLEKLSFEMLCIESELIDLYVEIDSWPAVKDPSYEELCAQIDQF